MCSIRVFSIYNAKTQDYIFLDTMDVREYNALSSPSAMLKVNDMWKILVTNVALLVFVEQSFSTILSIDLR